MNISCIICSDLISQTENIYFTKCGHVFHYHCLAQWMERSKSCPQCRDKVTEKCIKRVYFNFANSEFIKEDAITLQAKLDSVNLQIRQKDSELREQNEKIKTLEDKLRVNESLLKGTEKKLVSKETAILALKDQLEYCKVQSMETERLRAENEKLERSLNTMNGLQKVLNATADEVEQMLEDYTDVRMLATFASALKSALTQAEDKKRETRSHLQTAKADLTIEKKLVAKLQAQVIQLQEKLSIAERNNQQLLNKRKMADLNTTIDTIDDTPVKVRKSDSSDYDSILSMDSPPRPKTSLNMSINSLVRKIEESDSPYLQLKQGAGLTSLPIRKDTLPSHNFKPSEVAILKSSRSVQPNQPSRSNQEGSLSIFNRKQLNKSLDMFMDDMETARATFETSYDGLGGHSKPDVFPVPLRRSPLKKSPLKSCIPKLTPRHRLRNPKTQNIGKFFEKINR